MKTFLAFAFALCLALSAQDLNTQSQSATGNISAASASCVSTTCVWITMPLNMTALTVQLSGTWSATLQFEASTTGTVWSAIGAGSATSNGSYSVTLNGNQYFRVRASAYTSGTAVVNIAATGYGSASGNAAYPGVTSDGANGLAIAGGINVSGNATIGTTVLPIGWVDIRSTGAVAGCGASDDNGPAINAAVAELSSGGTIWISPGCYRVVTPIVLGNNIHLMSPSWSITDTPADPTLLKCIGAITCISAASSSTGVWISGIGIQGPSLGPSSYVAGSVGISLPAASGVIIQDVMIGHFGGQCISVSTGGNGLSIDNVFTQDCQNQATLGAVTGQVDVAANDAVINNLNVNGFYTTATHGQYGSGYNAAIVLRGARVRASNMEGDLAQVGIVCVGSQVKIVNSSAYGNQGDGFVTTVGSSCQVSNSDSMANGLDTTGTYMGFRLNGGTSLLVGNRVFNQISSYFVKYSFYDNGPSGANPNVYLGNTSDGTETSGIFGVSGSGNSQVSFVGYDKSRFQISGANGEGTGYSRQAHAEIWNPAGDTNNKLHTIYSSSGTGYDTLTFAKCNDDGSGCAAWMNVSTSGTTLNWVTTYAPTYIDNGTLVLYRCTVAGTLRVGQTTTVPGDCGTAVDTGLRIN